MAYARKLRRTARSNMQRMRKSSRAFTVLQARNRGGSFNRILQSARARHSAEVKTVDLTWAASGTGWNLNSTAQITPINLIQAGSTFTNRVGRRIEMHSLHMTGAVTNIANRSTVANDYARIIIVYDRQPNGAVPSIGTIFASYDQTTTATTSVTSGVNPDERERFVVLMDQRMVLPPVSQASAGVYGQTDGSIEGNKDVWSVNRFIKLRGLTTHFKADSSPAVIGDIATGSLLAITWGSINSGGEAFTYHYEARLRYKDT
nr:MAG: capsid protein [Cressdnaviricota sp.]